MNLYDNNYIIEKGPFIFYSFLLFFINTMNVLEHLNYYYHKYQLFQ